MKTAKNGVKTEATLPKYQDGTYRVEMKEDSHGWMDYLVVRISDGAVEVLEFDSINADGQLKSADEGYRKAMEEKTGTYPEKYSQDIIAAFQRQNDVTEMENVAGATVSSNSFKLMMGELLQTNARTGETETLTVNALPEDK